MSRCLRFSVVLLFALGACGGGGSGIPSAVPPLAGERPLGNASSQNTVILWNNEVLNIIRTTHGFPTATARSLTILHTCIFDAWAVGTRLGATLRRPLSERTLSNKNKAISYAGYRALLDLYPAQSLQIAQFMQSLGYDPTDASVNTATPSGIGNVACRAVLDYRHNDGSNQLGNLHPGAYSDYTGYRPVNDPDHLYNPNRWQPLRIPVANGGFTVQIYVTPFWGTVKPFALQSGNQFRPPPPAFYPSKDYLDQVLQVVDYSANLTDTTKVIAEYWRDGPHSETPPGHWCLFAQYVSSRDHHDVDADAKMFFMLTNALLDTSIAVWDAKRTYDYIRPISAVHFLYAGKRVRAWGGPYKGTRLIDGSTWIPYQPLNVVTPPFPEYVSGHSGFSAAGAEVLKRFTGSDALGATYNFAARTSTVEPGSVPSSDVRLYWATFTQAADQAAISRRYGGIHFCRGDLEARRMGRNIASIVWTKAQAYIAGVSP